MVIPATLISTSPRKICSNIRWRSGQAAQEQPAAILPRPEARRSPRERFDHLLRHGIDDPALVGMVCGEGHQHEPYAVRQLNVSRVVPRLAGPASLGPQLRAGYVAERQSGEGVALVRFAAFLDLLERIALHQLEHFCGPF